MALKQYYRFISAIITLKLALCCTDNLCREAVVDSSIKIKHLSTKRIVDHYLNLTVLETVEVISDCYCLHNCLKNGDCFSMNLHTNGTSLECSLLAEQAYANISELVKESNWTHLTVMNSFCEDPCFNGGTCIPNYDTDSGSCQCTDGFQGERCGVKEEVQPSEMIITEYVYGTTVDENLNDLLQLDAFMQNNPQSKYCLETFKVYVSGPYGAHVFAYFNPVETGNHEFAMKCMHRCQLYITTKGKIDRRLIAGHGSSGPTFRSNIKKVVFMKEGESYLIEYLGQAWHAVTVTNLIDVKFPSGHVESPLTKKYLSAT